MWRVVRYRRATSAAAVSRSCRANQSAAVATAVNSGSRGAGPGGPRSGVVIPTRGGDPPTPGGETLPRLFLEKGETIPPSWQAEEEKNPLLRVDAEVGGG